MMITQHTQRALPVVAFLMLAVVAGCGGDAATPAPAAAAPAHEEVNAITLDTAAIRIGGIRVGTADSATSVTLPVTGTITYDADRVSHVGPRTDGRIIALNVDLGRRVQRGDILVELESAEVGQVRADAQRSVALLRIARENYDREQRLQERGISSRRELLEAESEVRRLEAEVQSASDRLAVLGAGHGTGGHFDVTAPFAGTVVARAASLGQSATAADTLVTVADLANLWIELDIFERDLARVQRDQRVAVTTAAWPDRSFAGRIVYVGEVLDPVRRTVRARVELRNEGGMLRPGMFATAAIQVAGDLRAAVPQEAVQAFEGKSVVFVRGDRAGEFRAIPVEIGETLPDGRVIIRSGLTPGAAIVTTGAFTLRSELAKGEIGEGGH